MKTKPSTPTNWIQEGEKYALIGLQIKAEDKISSCTPSSHYSVLVDTAFAVPAHWREWLGAIRVEDIESCNIFLLTKCLSARPTILNEEDQALRDRINHFYVGLLLSSLAVPVNGAALLGGSMNHGEIAIRQQRISTP